MRTTKQMSVTLPHGMADMVRAKVASGEYASESEARTARACVRSARVTGRSIRGCGIRSHPRFRPTAGRSGDFSSADSGSSGPGRRQCARSEPHRPVSGSPGCPAAGGSLPPHRRSRIHLRRLRVCRCHRGALRGVVVFPLRGTTEALGLSSRAAHDQLHKKRAVTAIRVDDVASRVDILGVFYGGQDYETLLSAPEDAN